MTNDSQTPPQPAREQPSGRIEQIDDLNERAWEMYDIDPSQATELAELAGRLASQGEPYDRGSGWSLLTLGVCAMRRGEYLSAREIVTRAHGLLLRCGDRSGEARAIGNLGNVHYLLGEYPDAIERYQEWLSIERDTGNRSGQATVLNNIGNLLYRLGEYDRALEPLAESLTINREIDSRSGQANTLGSIGMVDDAMGEYGRALDHLRECLQINQEIGNRIGESQALGNIGNIHHALGEYSRALEHHQASLRISQEMGNPSGQGATLNNIGNLYNAMGDHAQALEQYRASLTINQEIGNRTGEAIALGNIGNIHHTLGEYRQGLEYHRACISINQDLGDRVGEASAAIGIGEALSALGDFPAALAELGAAVEIAREIGSRPTLAKGLLVLGRTYSAARQPERAIEILSDALALATELGERTHELEANELIAVEYEARGQTAQALRHLRRHLALQQEVFSQETLQTVQNLQTTWQMEVARREAEIERLRNVELRQAFEKLEQAHTELKSAQSQLVQQEKMASLGQLTAGIAHEINNPINFVTASIRPLRRDLNHLAEAIARFAGELPNEISEALMLKYDIDETLEEMYDLLTGIDSGASRTAEIVAGLRSFSRLDEGGLKGVDLHEGLDATLAILSAGMGERITIERKYGELPLVECYPGEINQVFMNILANAVKAIEGAGRVSIRSQANGERVSIEISDTGCGMTPEVQGKIFEPFFTTRDVGEGKGLGLSIAWGIVEKHGGTIAVTSRPAEGSSFTITLPRSA